MVIPLSLKRIGNSERKNKVEEFKGINQTC